ncbi:MAG: pyridoxamine 5'-phosphate oxidase family protein [Thermoleophilia bacterium]|nr:pyridoxamine 5'-phosphate oxidase family protein [Thermoleophilia bacterium]PHX80828.1 MAG: flavin-nucleotide-binding protein [Thermoleophilia bacterium]
MATSRIRVKRLPKRGHYDRATIDAILDEAILCHIGIEVQGQPYVIPSLHARVGDTLYLHGSSASRTLRTLAGGAPCCVTVTLVDGVVLARAVFDQSVNYRSVVVLGMASLVAEPAEKLRALEALSDQLVPGRWAETRPPTPTEIKATSILALTLDEASAKIRTGPPGNAPEDAEDYAATWTGVLPITQTVGTPIPAPDIAEGVALPISLVRWGDRFQR